MTALDIGETERFRKFIAVRLGLHFEESRLGFLREVLDGRAAAQGCGPADYLDRATLEDGREERGALATLLTVPETYFFRHMDQFDAVRDVALPMCMAAATQSRRLRILSAGCASGEEAYTLAMLIREAGLEPGWQVSIRAVDLNPAILRKARAGRFSNWALRETPAHLRNRWFHREGREFVLDASIRKAVTFEEHNLIDENESLWAAGSHDIIFCRNVLMYFTAEHMRRVVDHMAHALMPGGYLFLGHAETLRNHLHGFELCQTHGSFYYRRTGGRISTGTDMRGRSGARPLPHPGVIAIPSARAPGSVDWFEAIARSSGRVDELARIGAAAVADPAGLPGGIIEDVLHLLVEERFAEALELVDARAPSGTENPIMSMVRAATLAHVGRFAEAETAARDLLATGQGRVGAHYVLTLCREKAGDPKGAADHARSAAQLDASFAMPRLHIGLQARRTGNLDLARRELSRARILLRREEAFRIMLFGGGFTRQALINLCDSALHACGAWT